MNPTSNLTKSENCLKYKDLKSNLKPTFSNCRFEIATIEVSFLGYIEGLKQLKNILRIENIPTSLLNKLTMAAIDSSRRIYCDRNMLDAVV